MAEEIEDVTPGSGNIFRDLGLEDADMAHVKAGIAARIYIAVCERGLTQAQAAELLGIDQPKVSALSRGKLSGFTLDRLLKLANNIGIDVEIRLSPGQSKGRTGLAA